MWISKIELTNFKSYPRQVFEFPEPRDGQNIVLIGGLNGYGKTTLLEALYLGLYGKDSIAHLARAGLKTDEKRGYPTFLERAFNGEARRDGKDSMSVRIEIRHSTRRAFDVTRKWFFKSSGAWESEETIFREIKADVPQTPKKDGVGGFSMIDEIDSRFLPAHIAPFFFFDGEEVRKLADQSRVETVKQGLEGLLGVVLLRQLGERLRQFESNRRGDSGSADAELVGRLQGQLVEFEERIETAVKKQNDLASTLARKKAEFDALVERATAVGGTASDLATVKDLVEERQQFRQKLDEVNRKLENLLGTTLPILLVNPSVTESLKEMLASEQRLLDWNSEKTSFAPRVAEFERSFFEMSEPKVDPALTSTQVATLSARLQRAWESLFHPPPAGCAEEIELSFIADKTRAEVLDQLSAVGLSTGEFAQLLREATEHETQIQELDRRVTKLEGIDRDGTIQQMKNQLKTLQADLDALNEDLRSAARDEASLQTQATTVRAEYEREKRRLDSTSPMRKLIQSSEAVRGVIDEVIPALFPMKVKALGRAMTDYFKTLAHKSQITKIEVQSDGTARLLSASGQEVSFDRSAGENQIFATALIAGLAKVSNVKAPLVVDTPLARLDSMHRANIFNFWTSDPTRQVILLSQDKELDAELLRGKAAHLSTTYLLQHTDVGDGIGRTKATSGSYFKGVLK